MADKQEEWLPVNGYEGIYEVSNLGNIRSLSREVNCKYGKRITREKNICKNYNPKTGYYMVCLSKDRIKKTFLLHRLIATAFIDNAMNLPQVNHKNEIKTDNRAENLEWCDSIYNNNYGTKKERISQKNKISKCKPVMQIKDGVVINIFPSTISAKHIADPGHIGSCCNGQRKSAGGYEWAFVKGE